MTSRNTETPESQAASSPSSCVSPNPQPNTLLEIAANFKILSKSLVTSTEKIRVLENTNRRLLREVQTSQEMVNIIKSSIVEEFSEARKLLDAANREKARLENDNKRLINENKELNAGLEITTKDLKLSESSNATLRRRCDSVVMRCEQAQADAAKSNIELCEVVKERDELKTQVDDLRKKLEDESLARVYIDIDDQSLREVLTFKDQTLLQQLTDTLSKQQVKYSEVAERVAKQYEDNLQTALRDSREEHEGQMDSYRQEIKVLYDNKIKKLRSTASSEKATASAAMEELRQTRTTIDTLRTRIDTLTGQIKELENQNDLLASRSKDFETQLETHKDCHADQQALFEVCQQNYAALEAGNNLPHNRKRKRVDEEDNDGEESTTLERVRRPLASSTPRHREISGLLGESEELHHSQGDPQGKTSIM